MTSFRDAAMIERFVDTEVGGMGELGGEWGCGSNYGLCVRSLRRGVAVGERWFELRDDWGIQDGPNGPTRLAFPCPGRNSL